MTPYAMLFADQEIAEVLETMNPPQGSRLDVARARMWEGDVQETATAAAGAGEPWSTFLVAQARMNAGSNAQPQLKAIAENAFNESRVRLWAWTALRKVGEKPAAFYAKEVLGVVLEVPIDDEGVDVLAAYSDGSARYISFASQFIVWEPSTPPKDIVIDLISAAFPLLSEPPADRDPKAPPPEPGRIRITALSASGLHRVDVPRADVDQGGKHERLFVAAMALLRELTGV